MEDNVADAHPSLYGFLAGNSQLATQYPNENATGTESEQQEQPTQSSPPAINGAPSPIRSRASSGTPSVDTDITSFGMNTTKMELTTTIEFLSGEQRKEVKKLALMLCNSQIPLIKINEPFFASFLQERGVYIPDDVKYLDQELKFIHYAVIKKVKAIAENVQKYVIMLDIFKRRTGSALASVSLAHRENKELQVLFLGIRSIEICPNIDANHAVNETVRKILRHYHLSSDKVLQIVVNGFEEAFKVTFKPTIEVTTTCSFQHKLKEIFDKVVTTSPVYDNLKTLLTKQRKFLENYHIPLTKFASVSNFNSRMTTEELIKCFTQHRQAFLDIASQHASIKLNMLADEDWAEIAEMDKLYDLFNSYTKVFCDERCITVDQIIPLTSQLIDSLESGFTALVNIVAKLKQEIVRQFAHMTDPKHKDFDPFFVQATALNPNLLVLLDEDQREAAKTEIFTKLMDLFVNAEPPVKKRRVGSNNADESNIMETSDLHTSLLKAATLKRRNSLDDSRPYKEIYAEKLVKDYFEDIQNGTSFSSFFNFDENSTDDPVEFWDKVAKKCPEMSGLAIDILRLPAYTIAPENTTDSETNKLATPFGFLKSSEDDVDTLMRHAMIHYHQKLWVDEQ